MSSQPDGNYLFMFGTLPIPAIIHRGEPYLSLIVISTVLLEQRLADDIDEKAIISITDIKSSSINWIYGSRARFVRMYEALIILEQYHSKLGSGNSLSRRIKHCASSVLKSMSFEKLRYELPINLINLAPKDEISIKRVPEVDGKRKRDNEEEELPPPKKPRIEQELPPLQMYKSNIHLRPLLVVIHNNQLYLSVTMINAHLGFHCDSEVKMSFSNTVKFPQLYNEEFVLANSAIPMLERLIPKISENEIASAITSKEYLNLSELAKKQLSIGDIINVEKHNQY